jgi:hypothetical protein
LIFVLYYYSQSSIPDFYISCSATTAINAPKILNASFLALNLCSGLLSKKMVVDICKKLPLTMAYKIVKAVCEIRLYSLK